MKSSLRSITRRLKWLPSVACSAFLIAGSIRAAGAAEITDLLSLGGEQTVPQFISNGYVTGQFEPIGNPLPYVHAFLYKNGVFQDINPSFSRQSWGVGVNASGVVCGVYEDTLTSYSHAFIYDHGNFITLPAASAHGINDLGQVVGVRYVRINRNGPVMRRAFVYRDGEVIELNTYLPANSGWELEDGDSIDEQGRVIGWGMLNGFARQFMLTLP